MHTLVEPRTLFSQAQSSWVVKAALTKQLARLRNLPTVDSNHEKLLKSPWLEAAVYVVYTGWLPIDSDLEINFSYNHRKGWTDLIWGVPFSKNVRSNKLRYSLGQTLYKTVCQYDNLSNLIGASVAKYGAGLIQISSETELNLEQKESIVATFKENGTAQVSFTDKSTSITPISVRYDWEGVKLELEEKRVAIETLLCGADQRKSSTISSDAEMQGAQTRYMDNLFEQSAIDSAKRLFDIDLEFKISVDTIDEIDALAPYLSVEDTSHMIKELTDVDNQPIVPKLERYRRDKFTKPGLQI